MNDHDLPSPSDFNYDGGHLFVRLRRFSLARYLNGPATGEHPQPELLTLVDELTGIGRISPDGLLVLGRNPPATARLKVVLACLDPRELGVRWSSRRSDLEYGLKHADSPSHPLADALKPFLPFIANALPDLDHNPPTAELRCSTTKYFGVDRHEWTLVVSVAPGILAQLIRDYLAGYQPRLTMRVSLRTALNTHHESWRQGDEPKTFGILALPGAGATAYGWLTGFKCTIRPPASANRRPDLGVQQSANLATSDRNERQREHSYAPGLASEQVVRIPSGPAPDAHASRAAAVATIVTLGHVGTGWKWLRLLRALWR